MEYIYASLLLHSGGKEITEESLSKVVEAAGIQPDPVQIKATVAALKGINIDEAIKKGVTVASSAPAQVAAPQPASAEKPKEEKKEEEEVSAEGLGALFG
jgi:large subunit ribosomal protein L12